MSDEKRENSKGFFDRQAVRSMIDNGFEPEFSSAVNVQIDQISSQLAEPGIRDLSHLLWSSIDNETSLDLDQIEWCERKENGDIRLLVAIADVDSAIKKDTPIDQHAEKNTATIYTETEIFPMLPTQFSTGITSLNQNEDRVAIVADMTIHADGTVPDSEFYQAWVCNKAKLAYETLGPWLDGNAEMPSKVNETQGLREQLELQKEAAERLQKFRMIKGSLDFETVESAAVVENGEVKRIVSVMPNGARRLIENFMVTANVEMAEFLERHNSPSIRRVVEVPKRWDGIVKIAADLGTRLPDSPDQPSLAAFLNERRNSDPDHFPDLSLSIIKLIGSGLYIAQLPGQDVGGHFGLAVDDYAHSTAPNRRFVDMVVQRLVKAVINGKPSPYTNDELLSIADSANRQERAAKKVERKMRKIVAASVMKRHIGETFDAIVTGDNDKGVYARILRPPVDGRIVQNEQTVDVGDKVRVKLLGADPRNGFIDFAALK